MIFWIIKMFDCYNKMCYFNIIKYLAQVLHEALLPL